jgi:molybdate transport system substrate-binding protein
MTMASPAFRRHTRIAASAWAVALLATSAPAAAEDVYVLSAPAMQSVLKEIVGHFERMSGHRVVIRYATMGAFTRTLPDERADLVISSRQYISELARQFRIQPDTQLTICKTGVGVVVPSNTAKPPMTSIEDFKRALLDARIVLYADPAGGGAAGVHVARVIEQLGIADQLKAKTKLGAGGDITEVTLAEGDGALGITQISEIVGKAGATFAGPLPNELQNYTVVSAAIHKDAPESAAVSAFLAFLVSTKAVAVIKAKGMEVD